ncbi:transmembrane protein 200A [Stigmatopora nigra]
MTAAAGVLTGLAKLKRQDSARSQQRPTPAPGLADGPQEGAPRKRKRRTDVVVVRGRLRLNSASGFFLLLGLLVLAAGIAMATLGYWPPSQSPPGGGRSSVNSTLEGQPGGVLTRFLERHRHSEKMKMFGPFTMGIGIFIFICANAILHENRDRETKIIHMRDMYSTVIDIQRLRQKEQKLQFQHNYAREDPRNYGDDDPALAFSSWAASPEEEALLRDRSDCAFAGLLAPLYKDRSPSQGAAPERGGHRARSIVSSSISAFTLPVIKLNNCVIDEPEMEAITEEDRGGRRGDEGLSLRPSGLAAPASLAVPVASLAKASKSPRLHRSNSASSTSSGSSLAPSPCPVCWLSPGAARSDFGSDSSLHALGGHSKSLDLERQPSVLSVHRDQRKHPSWPRLDRSNSSRSIKGYTRLEDRGEGLPAAARRDYSKREKLLMISRSHNNLSFEHEDSGGGAMKRGSSESRF